MQLNEMPNNRGETIKIRGGGITLINKFKFHPQGDQIYNNILSGLRMPHFANKCSQFYQHPQKYSVMS